MAERAALFRPTFGIASGAGGLADAGFDISGNDADVELCVTGWHEERCCGENRFLEIGF
jgi:hypothetical protein